MRLGAPHGDEQNGGELHGMDGCHDAYIMRQEITAVDSFDGCPCDSASGMGNMAQMKTPDETPDEPAGKLLDECDVFTFRASGPGGQHRNRRESAVRLVHRPSGIVAIATERRSQHQNKAVALERLARKLADRRRVRKQRVATRATRAAQQRRIKEKKARAEVKRTRSTGRHDTED